MKKKINIRFAEKSDLIQITDIYNQAIRSKISTGDTEIFLPEERLDWFKHYDEKTFPVYVAEIDKNIVAYATLTPYRNARPAMRKIAEVSFFVDFKHHKKGIGSLILNYIMKDCSRLKKDTLIAYILDANPASARLLEKFGFEIWGKLPNAIDFETHRSTHLIYGKSLK
ncbi:MAG: hypothetical protein C0595_03210 [Marinilabiliales bacterium]|nr:MAG: hypothetical protein C0595_03210 [Marinilabiliales bacterium]